MSQRRPFTFDRVVRILATIIVLAALIWLVDYLRDVLLPFCVACLIAYILEPVVGFQLNKFHLRYRWIAVLLTLLEVAGVLTLLGYFFIPMAINEIGQLDKMIAGSRDVKSPFLPADLQDYFRKLITSDNLAQFISGTRFQELLTKSSSFLSTMLDYVLHTLEWFLTFIYVIFIMLDYSYLMRGFRLLVPPSYRLVMYRLGDDIKDTMSRYFRGQAVIAMCAAVFYCIGFSLVGLPLGIILGLTVGILYMIPYFQYITLIPVMILCYMDSMTGHVGFWSEFGRCILVYVVTQSICDYVLTPKIMKQALGLNPAIILLALSVWGSLLGIIGMIVALPMTTLLLAYYKEYVLAVPSRKNKVPSPESAADAGDGTP